MGGLQGRKRVAPHINEGFNACLSPFGLVLAGSTGELNDGTHVGQRFGSLHSFACVNLVRRAHTGESSARPFEGGYDISSTVEAVIGNGLNAAGLIEVFGVSGATGEIRDFSEVGQENFRSCPSLLQYAIRSIPQTFKRFGETCTR